MISYADIQRLLPLLTRKRPYSDVEPAIANSLPVLARQPNVDIGPPPSADPVAGMEMVRRSLNRPEMQPSYSPEGQPVFKTYNPAIPASAVLPEAEPMIASGADLPPLTRVNRVRVGEELKGSPLDRLITRREVTAGASPQSKIDTSDPNFAEVLPPHKRSRLKSFLTGAGLGALRGLAGGGLGGAIGGAITGGAIGGISPDMLSRFQRQEDLGRQDQEIARQYGQQKALSGLQDAQTERLYKLNRVEQGDTETKRKAQHDADLLEIRRQEIEGTISRDEANRRERQLDREERAEYHRGVLSRQPKAEKPDTSGFTNDQIEHNIKDAEGEQQKIWSQIQNIPPTMAGEIQGQTVPNPIYTEGIKRIQKLQDDVRDWRGKRKAPLTRNTGGSYSEADVRARAIKLNKDPDAAVQAAKEKGLLK